MCMLEEPIFAFEDDEDVEKVGRPNDEFYTLEQNTDNYSSTQDLSAEEPRTFHMNPESNRIPPEKEMLILSGRVEQKIITARDALTMLKKVTTSDSISDLTKKIVLRKIESIINEYCNILEILEAIAL